MPRPARSILLLLLTACATAPAPRPDPAPVAADLAIPAARAELLRLLGDKRQPASWASDEVQRLVSFLRARDPAMSPLLTPRAIPLEVTPGDGVDPALVPAATGRIAQGLGLLGFSVTPGASGERFAWSVQATAEGANGCKAVITGKWLGPGGEVLFGPVGVQRAATGPDAAACHQAALRELPEGVARALLLTWSITHPAAPGPPGK